MLNKAFELAKTAHTGQVDKSGKPYILHPITVAGMVDTEEEKIVALLHDVVEDTLVTLEELRHQGFSETIVAAVDVLTKRPGVDYADYIHQVKQNSLALTVKIADMTHNMDLSRIPNPTDKDYARIEKYKRALPELKIEKG
ncbi:HD domain-containing protein [Sporomusa sphaeroides DSM 2875]|uniref:HD domain-containing protein n=1 Tax=Sporomusa sphaeroides TaxID=47679 RepID=UPI00202E2D8F|nr:HD domain-containing protein [Sporomusa sphaeroides]MCM0759955.1 HD domain-containing protein [Sporomusa sphaeroides DSM 2875]